MFHCVYKTISFNLVYKTSVKLNSKQYTQQFVLFKFSLNFTVEKCETTISYIVQQLNVARSSQGIKNEKFNLYESSLDEFNFVRTVFRVHGPYRSLNIILGRCIYTIPLYIYIYIYYYSRVSRECVFFLNLKTINHRALSLTGVQQILFTCIQRFPLISHQTQWDVRYFYEFCSFYVVSIQCGIVCLRAIFVTLKIGFPKISINA